MYILLLGLGLFLIPHSTRIIMPSLRENFIETRGKNSWQAMYSISSVLGLGLIIWGWMLYRPEADIIYDVPEWGRYVTSAFLWAALVLTFMTASFAGRIVVWVKHPMVTSLFLWSTGHLFANGDMASLLLFGSFAVYAVADRISVATRHEPDPVFKSYLSDIVGLVGGTVAFLVLYYWAHEFMFGLSPMIY